ncbi:MAG TPA: hypothetical protein VGC76_15780 [Pyrinomonadaceae bacterium]|jgi:hypothetical protein
MNESKKQWIPDRKILPNNFYVKKIFSYSENPALPVIKMLNRERRRLARKTRPHALNMFDKTPD